MAPDSIDQTGRGASRDAHGNRSGGPARPRGPVPQRPAPSKDPAPPRSAHKLAATRIALGMLALALLSGVYVKDRWKKTSLPPRPERPTLTARLVHGTAPPAAPVEPDIPPTEVAMLRPPFELDRDGNGKPVAIHGADPAAVLTGWCATHVGCDPGSLALAHTVPDHPGQRIGLFRTSAAGGTTQLITIFKSRRRSGWVTGDGVRPVPVFEPTRFPFSPPVAIASR